MKSLYSTTARLFLALMVTLCSCTGHPDKSRPAAGDDDASAAIGAAGASAAGSSASSAGASASAATTSAAIATAVTAARDLSFQVVNVFPHDTSVFTEGLEFHDSLLYESGGLYKKSTLAARQPVTGKIVVQKKLDKQYFGEGISILGDQLYQLTLDEHAVFVYHIPDLTLERIGEWAHEGWGMTNDGQRLISSDGSDKLYFIDPHTLKETGHLSVTLNGAPLDSLNELEYVDGKIFANHWYSDKIYKIDAQTGRVEGVADLGNIFQQAGLSDRPLDDGAVLNGLAWSKTRGTLFVTGKNWPKMFELRFE